MLVVLLLLLLLLLAMAEGLNAVITALLLFVVAAVAGLLGNGLLTEWLPLPRAAGTSWLCFPS